MAAVSAVVVMLAFAGCEFLTSTNSATVAVMLPPVNVLLPIKYRLESSWLQVWVVAIRLELASRSGSVVVELGAQPARQGKSVLSRHGPKLVRLLLSRNQQMDGHPAWRTCIMKT